MKMYEQSKFLYIRILLRSFKCFQDEVLLHLFIKQARFQESFQRQSFQYYIIKEVSWDHKYYQTNHIGSHNSSRDLATDVSATFRKSPSYDHKE